MKADKEQKRREKQISRCSDSFIRGLCATVVALAVYIALPLVIEDAFFPMISDSMDLDALSDLLDRWVIAGVPLVVLAFLSRYYGLGTVRCLGFSVLRQVMKMTWLLYVIRLGDLTGLISYSDGDIQFEADLMLNGLVIILLVLMVLKIVIHYCDYRDNRDVADELNCKDESDDDPIRVKGRFS